MNDRLYGVHTSIAGGLERAVEEATALKCTTFQIFLQSPRIWKTREPDIGEIESFKDSLRNAGFRVFFVHCSYLINLISENKQVAEKSLKAFIEEVEISSIIGAKYYVLHLRENRKETLTNQLKALKSVFKFLEHNLDFKGCGILIENSPYGENFSNLLNLAKVYEELKEVSSFLSGICLDTAHLHAYGYNLSERIEDIINDLGSGVSLVKLVHLNDSKSEVGTRMDRHENLGQGSIGRVGLLNFLKLSQFSKTPVILETPKKGLEDDEKNLQVLRELFSQVRNQ
ncbi:MAG: deoxyribonuclease IV [Actinobacteria bacterium]|nr:deoxyribonuclease IV [Actinomycetota bacterium]